MLFISLYHVFSCLPRGTFVKLLFYFIRDDTKNENGITKVVISGSDVGEET